MGQTGIVSLQEQSAWGRIRERRKQFEGKADWPGSPPTPGREAEQAGLRLGGDQRVLE